MNENYLYAYDITIWNDLNCKEERVKGIAWAGTWADLMTTLGKYYGDTDINEIHSLKCLAESTTGVVEFDDNMYQQLVDYENYL